MAFCLGLTGWKGWGWGPAGAHLSQESWFWQLNYQQLEWSPISLVLLKLMFSCLLCLECQLSWLVLCHKVCVTMWDEKDFTNNFPWSLQIELEQLILPKHFLRLLVGEHVWKWTKQNYYHHDLLQEETLPTHLIQVAIMTDTCLVLTTERIIWTLPLCS